MHDWLMQFLQWQDFNGGWLGVIVILWLAGCLLLAAITMAVEYVQDQDEKDLEELEKEMEMWQDTEIWE